MSHPYFSVLMCAHRDDAFVLPAIRSVLRQTDGDFEFVIVLNACPDTLHERIAQVADDRLRLYRTAIGQLAFNLNYGLDLCRGQFVVRFDADDLCHPERLQRTRVLINRHPTVDIVAGSCRIVAEDGAVHGGIDVARVRDWRATLRWRNPFVHPATAIRRDRLLQLGGYTGGLRSEDYDLWLRMAALPDVTAVVDAFPMIDYRVSGQQASGSRLGYAEVAAHLLRECLMRPRLGTAIGVLVAVAKVFLRGGRRS